MILSTSVLISSAPLQAWLPPIVYAHFQGVLEAVGLSYAGSGKGRGKKGLLPRSVCPCDFFDFPA